MESISDILDFLRRLTVWYVLPESMPESIKNTAGLEGASLLIKMAITGGKIVNWIMESSNNLVNIH